MISTQVTLLTNTDIISYVLSVKMSFFLCKTVTGTLQNVFGAWVMFASVAVGTWRVTMLIHPTAAFLLKLGHQLCGAMHDGSDAAVWLAASH